MATKLQFVKFILSVKCSKIRYFGYLANIVDAWQMLEIPCKEFWLPRLDSRTINTSNSFMHVSQDIVNLLSVFGLACGFKLKSIKDTTYRTEF